MSDRTRLLFITTSSLASNPRLVKEFECLKAHYSCTVLCFKHHDWSLALSEAIKARNEDVRFIEIDRQQSVLETIKAKMLHKFAIAINSLFQKRFKVCAFASNDKTPQLVFNVKKLQKKQEFQHIIAHNLGAFYPAVITSQSQNATLQLDIEDFYPGEALYFNKTYEKANRDVIMQTSFGHATHITYASKGIALTCKKAFKTTNNVKHTTIINVFKETDFLKPEDRKGTIIKCVWFSQHIGPHRGLDQVFEAAKTHPEIEFHIIGNANTDYLSSIDLTSNIKLHATMEQTQLHQFLRTMDIGLALESKHADANRAICLTNKILAYAQAGLYILATDTFGQRDFLNILNYAAGELIKTNLSTSFSNFDSAILSHENKVMRWEEATSFSWEKEQLKLMKTIQ
jgi:glycosyltransferase involved in cell wall biosynthesis